MELKPGYKLTDVGVIPEDWDVKPLKALLARSRLGGNYANQETETSYPLMKMGNLDRGFFDVSKVEYVKAGAVPDEVDRLRYGDLLFNTRNTLDLVGKVAIWADELPVAYYNSNLLRLEFDPELVPSPWYANAVFNSHSCLVRLRGLATGTTSVAAIYGRDLWKLQFVIAPLAEQRAIAGALSDVDALIGALDQLLAKKRDLKQAAMQQLLTGHQRLPGFAPANPRFQQTDVGEIPEDWEVERIRPLAAITTGSRNTQDRIEDGAYPFFVRSSTVERINSYSFDGEAVLTAGDGVGTGKVFHYINGKFDIHQRVYKISDFSPRLVGRFFFLVFSTRFYDRIMSMTAKSSVDSVRMDMIANMPIPLPSPAEQTAIAEVLSDMDAELAALEQKRDKTRLLKQGMMQELLTGRTRLI